jgi:hypothetical protein
MRLLQVQYKGSAVANTLYKSSGRAQCFLKRRWKLLGARARLASYEGHRQRPGSARLSETLDAEGTVQALVG